jgi:hypothetical protein
MSNLPNGLQVDEILILKKIQINEDLKDIYVFSNYACYNHNISHFQCEVDLNTILIGVIFKHTFNLFLLYQSCLNFVHNLL